MLKFCLALGVAFLFMGKAQASSYSQCHMMGVVENVYFNKIHFRPLKIEDTVKDNWDQRYNTCKDLEGYVIALYDNSEDAANEPCKLTVQAPFKTNKIKNRFKDYVQQGDMLVFDYTFYQSMNASGGFCVKDWRLLEHVPLKKKAS